MRSPGTGGRIVLVAALALAACSPAPAELSADAGVPNPDPSLEIHGPHLFELDTTTRTFELKVNGTRDLVLAGELADDHGRRRIVLARRTKGYRAVVFESDWNLPAVAAVRAGGEIEVCANRLVGHDTPRTKGIVPDPATGVALYCRRRSKGTWQPERRIDDGSVAARWLVNLEPAPGEGFRLTVQPDPSGQLVGRASEQRDVEMMRL